MAASLPMHHSSRNWGMRVSKPCLAVHRREHARHDDPAGSGQPTHACHTNVALRASSTPVSFSAMFRVESMSREITIHDTGGSLC